MSEKDTIRFLLYDKDLAFDDSMGVLDLSLSHLRKGKPCVAWYEIPRKQGEIRVALTARDFGRIPKRPL